MSRPQVSRRGSTITFRGKAAQDLANMLGGVPGHTREKKPKRKRKTCTIGARCRRHSDQVHGGEAEQLRKGIEELIRESSEDIDGDERYVCVSGLQRLLDRTDARDSLAFLEATDGQEVTS